MIQDSNPLRDNQSGELMLPNGDTGFYQYIDAEAVTCRRALPRFRGGVGWKNFMRIMTDPGIQSPMQICLTVIFSACSVAFTLAIRHGAGVGLVQWGAAPGAWFLPGHADPAHAIPAFISILVFRACSTRTSVKST